MPVSEGQEPTVPNGGQPVVEPPDEDPGYGTYDPTEYLPKVETGDDDDRPAQDPGALYDEEGKRLPSFDQRYADDFEGLIYLGALTRSFDWLGHRFVVRTVRTDDVLAVAKVIDPWRGTVGEAKAYAAAMAAICVVSVDGKELPIPVGDGQGEYAWAYQRFDYVKANWFAMTIDKVYSEYLVLEQRVNEVIDAMEKASGPAASMSGSNATSAGPTGSGY